MASFRTQGASSSCPPPPPPPPSSSSSIPQWKYDVFLSFRGEDTRKNFTDHLYAALNRTGIYTFRDDLKLERGKVIGLELLKAIEESRFSIIILSKTYASSTWCLDELVKIVECKNKLGQKIMPVFYDVDPSEVRNQTGNFQEAFAEHEEEFMDNLEKVQRWRAAMREVGNLRGFHLKDRHESEFIEDIVKEISNKLSPTLSSVVKEFVGIDSRLEKLSLHIGLGLDDVRLVGICGMGGIGKTTLARVVYNQMSRHFEGSSFLANVREVSQEGHIVSLQEQLLSQILRESNFRIWDVDDGIDMIRSRLCRKKILVIVDDVDHIDQLEKLAGNHDWFGFGSRIIITTRDEHLLTAHGVNFVYKAECLDHDEALQLFSLKAFKNDHPPKNYIELCEQVVKYADGLPLALKVLGSFLFDRSVDEWISALERLKEDSEMEILDRLQISFDGLKETEKNIFLDIAFFFRGVNKDYVIKILDSCGFYPNIGIKVLTERCLITISIYNDLLMHDLMQEMAKKIVEKESPKVLGKRTRLWNKDEVDHVLMQNEGTEAVEGIIHKFIEEEKVYLSAKAFSKVNKLRLLKISNVQLSQGLDYLSNELRFLEWHGYPLKSLPSSFQPDKIVVLNLCHSCIQQLWKGIKPLNKLKLIDMSHSQNLTRMPDFTGVPNLESLILEGCTRLLEVHPSIGVLKRLTLLNLKDCKSLSSLPNFVKLESLEVCILAGCSKLKKFPEIIGKMESLKKLDVSGTTIGEFPSSIFLLMKNLEELSFHGCKGPSYESWSLLYPFQLMRRSLDPMPFILPSLSGFNSLAKLDLSDCNLLEGKILNDLGCLFSLKQLDLSHNSFVSLPTSIRQLSNLSYLYLDGCKKLKSLPELPSNTEIIDVLNCTSLKTLPDASKSHRLASVSFNGLNCFKLVEEGGSNVAFAMMKKYLQERPIDFEVLVPGNEIPEWFTHQNEGSSTSIEMPALFLHSNNNKLIALAACCVFVHEHPPIPSGDYSLRFILEGHKRPFFTTLLIEEDESLPDHLWLFFLSYPSTYFKTECEREHSPIRGLFLASGRGLVVKKCAIRPVYEHDVEDFNQTMNQCNSSIFENFNDLHHDLDKSAQDGAGIKRIRDGCNSAETSGSGSSNEQPETKKLK